MISYIIHPGWIEVRDKEVKLNSTLIFSGHLGIGIKSYGYISERLTPNILVKSLLNINQ